MIVLTAKYFVKAGNGDEVEAALRRMAPLVKASEPGCKLYHANRSAENPICSCSTSTTPIRPRSTRTATRHTSRRSSRAPSCPLLDKAGARAVSVGDRIAGRT